MKSYTPQRNKNTNIQNFNSKTKISTKKQTPFLYNLNPSYETYFLPYVLIDTIPKAESALERISSQSIISIDLEGYKLGKYGSIALISIAFIPTLEQEPDILDIEGDSSVLLSKIHTYLFDVQTLGQSLFDLGMVSILEREHPIKLAYDFRRDAEALYSLYNIRPISMFDLQIAVVLDFKLYNNNDLKYLPGFAKSISIYCTNESKAASRLKTLGKNLFPTYDWKMRPFQQIILDYATLDVVSQFLLYKSLKHLTSHSIIMSTSERRIHDELAKQNPDPNDSNRAIIDFKIPEIHQTLHKTNTSFTTKSPSGAQKGRAATKTKSPTQSVSLTTVLDLPDDNSTLDPAFIPPHNHNVGYGPYHAQGVKGRSDSISTKPQSLRGVGRPISRSGIVKKRVARHIRDPRASHRRSPNSVPADPTSKLSTNSSTFFESPTRTQHSPPRSIIPSPSKHNTTINTSPVRLSPTLTKLTSSPPRAITNTKTHHPTQDSNYPQQTWTKTKTRAPMRTRQSRTYRRQPNHKRSNHENHAGRGNFNNVEYKSKKNKFYY